MRFASLGSGSRGNALVVEAGSTRILVDCGFGPRNLAARLARLGLSPDDLDAILVTHEHADHVGGVAACARRYGLDVFLTHGTAGATLASAVVDVARDRQPHGLRHRRHRGHAVPGAARCARAGAVRLLATARGALALLTDAGCVTPHMVRDAVGLRRAGAGMQSRSPSMLAGGRYPPHLKRRIAGRFGHLDNAAAARAAGADRSARDCSTWSPRI